ICRTRRARVRESRPRPTRRPSPRACEPCLSSVTSSACPWAPSAGASWKTGLPGVRADVRCSRSASGSRTAAHSRTWCGLTEAGGSRPDVVILGVNAFHADSSACLVVDGELRMAVAEERLGSRQKHSPCFPAEAVRRVLADSGVRLRDVTHVAIPRDVRANRRAKYRYALRHPRRSMPALFEHLRRSSRTEDMVTRLAGICGEEAAPVRFQTVAVEHHLAHIASSYYMSPFDGVTAAFSYDASGDFVSALMARCEGTRITPVARVALPASLGFFYTALCQFIGFDQFGEEYKVMGLAPYGDDAYADIMKDLLRLDPSGWFHLAPGYFGMHQGGASGEMRQDGGVHQDRMFTPLLIDPLGMPRSRPAAL